MTTFFITNPRILVLALVLICTSGGVAFWTLPRMEDPLLTPRAATLTTILPGADADHVETLVTDKLEQSLREISEIKELNSTSRAGVSFIAIELKDEIDETQAHQIWSQIRNKADDARLEMPAEARRPEFNRLDIKAYALIVGLRWESDEAPRYGVLRRWMQQLKDRIDAIPGTEKSDAFGDPKEEIVVTIDPESATAMNLNADLISKMIFASDAKSSAGQLRGVADDVLLGVSGELDSITQLSHLPIRLGEFGNVVELADIATIEKSIRTPVDSKVLLKDQAAIALGVFVEPSVRLDWWMSRIVPVLDRFEAELPPGIALEPVFDQSDFVNSRMQSLLQNLLYGAGAIFLVILVVMGWRSAWVISLALPLGSLLVLFVMYVAGIPIHQISITGLIIAMGLMIDNAIVVVDEVDKFLQKGCTSIEAVRHSVSFLSVPLLGATLTTVLSFGPIALMPGPSGEFVGSIAVVAIIAVASSYLLALTAIASIAGLVLKKKPATVSSAKASCQRNWLVRGYAIALRQLFRFPIVAVALGLVLPIYGFMQFQRLPEQFFPPADRNQFQLELELPGTGSIAETELFATQIRQELLKDPAIVQVAWFLGESAPPFYYNIIPDRKNTSRYGQAIVDVAKGSNTRQVIHRVQKQLDQMFPSVSTLARQLEQGPPFAAPIEIRIFGPDSSQLQQIGEQVRLVLTQTPDVIHTRSNLADSVPKITFDVDEQQARFVGLNHLGIAAEMSALLEGVVGGSILEDTEMLPVRVRVSDERRADLNQIASMSLVSLDEKELRPSALEVYRGIPISAISKLKLTVESGAISRLNGIRMNEVQGYIQAGVLPAKVQAAFERQLLASGFKLPDGFSLAYAGAEAERNDAVGNLFVNGAILFALMVATLVIALKSFRLTALLFGVAALSVGFGLGTLAIAGLSWGFMSIVGIMGMIGIAVNDSIVILAALQELPRRHRRDPSAISECIVANTRHILATTLTTIAGFTPLFLSGGEFWPPVAIAISGGVVGATGLAILFVPSMYMLLDINTVVTENHSG